MMKKYRYGTDVSIDKNLTVNGKIESDSVIYKISPESDNMLKDQNGLYVEKATEQEITISTDENNSLVDNNGLYVKKPDSTIKIDPSEDNTLVLKDDGLFSESVQLVSSKEHNGIVNNDGFLYMKPVEQYLVLKQSSTNGLVNFNGLYIKKPSGDVLVSSEIDNLIKEDDKGLYAIESKLSISSDPKNTITESSTGGLFAETPIQPEYIKISTESENLLIDNNGLYVPKIDKLTISNESGNIVKDQNGLYAKSEGGVIKISTAGNNAIVLNDDGLYLRKYNYISSKINNAIKNNDDGLYVSDTSSSSNLNPLSSLTDDGYVKEVQVFDFEYDIKSGTYLNEVMFLLTNNSIIEYNVKERMIKNTVSLDLEKILPDDGYSCILQGEYAVFIPYKGTNIIVYSVKTHEILKYVDIPVFDGHVEGDIAYKSAVLGEDGNIYCMPYDASKILKITNTHVVSFIDMLTLTENIKGKFSDTIISNGKYIVGVPYKSNFIVRYNINTSTHGKVGVGFTGNNPKWNVGTIIKNSELVFYPGELNNIIHINNDNTSWTVDTSTPNIDFKAKFAINGLDSNVYIISTDNRLIRTSSSKSFSVIKDELPELTVFLNSYDGVIYGFGNKKMIKLKSAQYGINTWALSPYINKN